MPSFTATAWDQGFFSSLSRDGGVGLGRTEQNYSQSQWTESGSATELSVERSVDQSKDNKIKGNGRNCQPKHRTLQTTARTDQMWGGGGVSLKDSLDQHCSHVEEIMDSLESSDLLSEHRAQIRRTRNQLRDTSNESKITDQPISKTRQVTGLGTGDHRREPARVRTASALLSLLLEDVGLSGCAAELISLLSQVARSSIRASLLLIPVEPAVLCAALRHPEDSVRAAACSLLGNLDPLVGVSASDTDAGLSLATPRVLLEDLVGCLCDSSPSVRKRACRAVGTWLGLIALAGPGKETTFSQSHEPKSNRNAGASSGSCLARVRGRGERRGSTDTCLNRPVLKVQDREEGWTEVALGTVAPLVSLLRDPDALTRQHSCSALGNVAGLCGGRAALLEADAQRLLLHVAQADSQHAVQKAASAALYMFEQQDLQGQVRGLVDRVSVHDT